MRVAVSPCEADAPLVVDPDAVLTAAVTFTWSGWFVQGNYLPAPYEAMSWMPLIVLLVDKVLGGAPWAWLWLIIAWACQVLIGAVEPVIHTVYVAALKATSNGVHDAKSPGRSFFRCRNDPTPGMSAMSTSPRIPALV